MNEKWTKLFDEQCLEVLRKKGDGILTPRDVGELAREAIAVEMERLRSIEEFHWDIVEKNEREINRLKDHINFLEWTQYKGA